MSTMCNALAYARLGWPVLPLCAPLFNEDGKPVVTRDGLPACTHSLRGEQCGGERKPGPGKIPIAALTPSGANSARTSEATVRGWFTRVEGQGHALNYGLAMGHGRFALDLDTYKNAGALEELEEIVGKLPATVEFHTGGGGVHLVFAVPEGVVVKQAAPRGRDGKPIEGIDVRSTGGYLVGPGSLHASGATYRAELSSDPLDGVQPTLAPEALVRHLTQETGAELAPVAQDSTDGRLPDGERKSALVSLAGTMHSRGMSKAAIVAAIVADDATRCDPPLGVKEATRIATWVTKKPRSGKGSRAKGAHGANASLERVVPYAEVISADLFVTMHGDDLLYCHERGWRAWSGTRWEHDELRPYALAQDFARTRGEQAVRNGADRKTLTTVLKNATVNAILALARAQLAVRQAAFDADPWLFNCASGTIDLRTGEMREHLREDRCTKISPVAFDPAAICPTWDAFLERVLPDADVRAFVQRLAGLAMLGEQREHVLPVFYGRGANGKSTFLEALQFAFGDYASAIPSDVLMQRKNDPHPTEKAQLFGLRLAVASETKQGRSLDEGTMKSLTGGDRIKARYMCKDFFEFEPTHSLILASNYKPKIEGTDEGIWRRLLLVPWDVTVPEAERDTALGAKLRAEAPGILRWCLEGFRAWHAQGLAPPASVRLATMAYRSESDAIGEFLTARCARLPEARTQASVLYQAFESWCRDSGETPMTQTAFGRALSDEHGLEKTKSNTIYWKGIGLLAKSDAPAVAAEPDALGGLGQWDSFPTPSPRARAHAQGDRPGEPSHYPNPPVALPLPLPVALPVNVAPPRPAPWERKPGTAA